MQPRPPLEAIPATILAAADYLSRAADHLPSATLAWLEGGSGAELTLRANRDAFAGERIIPRLLVDMTRGHTRLSVLGQTLEHPVLLAPLGHMSLLHPAGEIGVAQAAAATDSGMITSTLASCPLEQIADATTAPRWFQLYFQRHRKQTLELLRRAERAGFNAIVVTLDAPLQPPSRRAQLAAFQAPTAPALASLSAVQEQQQVFLEPGQSRLLQGMMSEAPTWADLQWLLEETSLPVLIKGVMHPDDAVALKAAGVAGIVVSNHGGRALDSAPATLQMLPAVRRAVGDDYPVLLDGGIHSGSDVFKALARGADAVLIGRLQASALAVAGALGVAHMLQLLREELELCMALAGTPTLADIRPDCLYGEYRC
ncbi:alpha-hydroxy acid oxidase [Pseudomonas sp.]|uniref:alpha-hydroxy acid oxidase n=1 Tax=Pseudomonas sp. TaxID=306 RepID=UPI00272C4E2C|nr:alpha-hydroxy acid oxidase [Pseudomonas sp.]